MMLRFMYKKTFLLVGTAIVSCTMPVNHATTEVYFSPDDKITDHLLEHLNCAQSRIYAAVYMITCPRIAQALIAAHQRGVDVQIITDHMSVDSEFGKVHMLMHHGVPVRVFRTKMPGGRQQPLMHDKFAIIDDKTWSGSFNWTRAANLANHEDAQISTNLKRRDRFLARFATIKNERSSTDFTCNPKQFLAMAKAQNLSLSITTSPEKASDTEGSSSQQKMPAVHVPAPQSWIPLMFFMSHMRRVAMRLLETISKS